MPGRGPRQSTRPHAGRRRAARPAPPASRSARPAPTPRPLRPQALRPLRRRRARRPPDWLDAAPRTLPGVARSTRSGRGPRGARPAPARGQLADVLGAVALAAACDALAAPARRALEAHDARCATGWSSRLAGCRAAAAAHLGRLRRAHRRSQLHRRGADAGLVAAYLSAEHGIGVRDGRFCAHPLLARLGVPEGALRASVGVGSTLEDVDRLTAALAEFLSRGREPLRAGGRPLAAGRGPRPLAGPRAADPAAIAHSTLGRPSRERESRAAAPCAARGRRRGRVTSSNPRAPPPRRRRGRRTAVPPGGCGLCSRGASPTAVKRASPSHHARPVRSPFSSAVARPSYSAQLRPSPRRSRARPRRPSCGPAGERGALPRSRLTPSGLVACSVVMRSVASGDAAGAPTPRCHYLPDGTEEGILRHRQSRCRAGRCAPGGGRELLDGRASTRSTRQCLVPGSPADVDPPACPRRAHQRRPLQRLPRQTHPLPASRPVSSARTPIIRPRQQTVGVRRGPHKPASTGGRPPPPSSTARARARRDHDPGRGSSGLEDHLTRRPGPRSHSRPHQPEGARGGGTRGGSFLGQGYATQCAHPDRGQAKEI